MKARGVFYSNPPEGELLVYPLTMLLAVIAVALMFKHVGQGLWKERADLAAGAKSLSLGGLYLLGVLALVALAVMVGMLFYKLLLFG